MSTTTNALINPFKEARLNQNLSQYEIARRVGVTKHAILRLEQGMFAEPLPAVINYYVEHFPVNRSRLIDEYQAFQINTREANAGLLGDFTNLESECPVGTHPLTFLRERAGFNLTSLAKNLCISQSVVGYFEKRPIHQHSIPTQLVEALMDADYSSDEITILNECYKDYRHQLISDMEFTSV